MLCVFTTVDKKKLQKESYITKGKLVFSNDE